MYISIMRMIARKRIRNTSGRSLLREPVCHSRRAHLQKRRMCHGGVSSFTPLLSWSLPSWAGRPMLITLVSVHLWSWLLWNRSRTAGQDCAARWLYGVAERLFQTDLFIGGWRKARGVQLEGEAIFDVKHKMVNRFMYIPVTMTSAFWERISMSLPMRKKPRTL